MDSPENIAGAYEFRSANFGPPLPQRPLSAPVVMAEPPHACGKITNGAQLAGAIALIVRGPDDDAVCPLPHQYFADKVKQAQDAKAVAVVVANTDGYAKVGRGGLVTMQVFKYSERTHFSHMSGVSLPTCHRFNSKKPKKAKKAKKSLFRLLLNVAHPLLPYLKKSFRQEEKKTHTRRKHTKSPPVFKPRTRAFSPYVTHKKPAPLFSNTAPLLSLHV